MMKGHGVNSSMTMANAVTLLRLLLAGPVVYSIVAPAMTGRWTALTLFLIAASTDGVDGYLARSRGEESRLGRLLDPVADKVLGLATFAALVWVGFLPGWLLWVLVAKESLLLLGGLALLGSRHIVVAARPLGKVATVVLFGSFILLLAGGIQVGLVAAGIGVGISVAAGIDYGINAVRALTSKA